MVELRTAQWTVASIRIDQKRIEVGSIPAEEGTETAPILAKLEKVAEREGR